mmetsp:Transcript_35439/g.62932  ORF Transcript_35439/g.62932 Transcript_35439/m.62932 type:complete len:242 (-) Transcript_35439:520-1245(-)
MHLNGPICCFAAKPVRTVIAHAHFVTECPPMRFLGHPIEFPCSLSDQFPQHSTISLKLHQRKLNGLVSRQWLAKGRALQCIFHRLVDTILCRTKTAGCLPEAVFLKKEPPVSEAMMQRSQVRVPRHPHIRQPHPPMITWHVERPQELLLLKARCISWYDKIGDTCRIAIFALRPCKHHCMLCSVHTCHPHFPSIDDPLLSFFVKDSTSFHPRCVAAMVRFGEAKGSMQSIWPSLLLLRSGM